METATVLYDVDCGFCRWTMARVLAWDRRRRLRPVAIQDAEGEALLARLDPAARLESAGRPRRSARAARPAR